MGDKTGIQADGCEVTVLELYLYEALLEDLTEQEAAALAHQLTHHTDRPEGGRSR